MFLRELVVFDIHASGCSGFGTGITGTEMCDVNDYGKGVSAHSPVGVGRSGGPRKKFTPL